MRWNWKPSLPSVGCPCARCFCPPCRCRRRVDADAEAEEGEADAESAGAEGGEDEPEETKEEEASAGDPEKMEEEPEHEEDDVEKTKESNKMGAKVGLIFSMILTSVFLIASLALVLYWVIQYCGSFAWDDVKRHERMPHFPIKFNFHPTLMIGGFIFLSGFSMLMYRMMTCCRKLIVKLLHTIFHALAAASIAVGFLAIWDSKENGLPRVPHFYSLHSWMGLTTMGLFVLQFVVGFFSFLVLLCCEGGTAACRAALAPTHATFGLITFIMACATAVVGLTETALTTLNTPDSGFRGYERWLSDMSQDEAIYINVLAVVIAAALISMVFTLSVRSNRRPPLKMTYHTDL